MRRIGILFCALFAGAFLADAPLQGQTQEQVSRPPICDPFVIFFAFRSAGFSEEARQILEDAIARARISDGSDIYITGTYHSPGPEEYYPSIAELRIEAVKTEMIRHGVRESTITTNAVPQDFLPPYLNPENSDNLARRVQI